MDRPGSGHVENPPAGVVHALLEVHLLRVDEEVRVQVADALRDLTADQHRAGLDPANLAGGAIAAVTLGDEAPMEQESLRQRRLQAWKAPGAGDRSAVRVHELRSGDRGPAICAE